MNAEHPAIFQAILGRPSVWRRLLGSTAWVLTLYAAALVAVILLSKRVGPPARKARRELTVTLLDAPKIARLRGLGALGGGIAGEAATRLTGEQAPRADEGRAARPALHSKNKQRDSDKSLPQDRPRATVGVMVQPEPTAPTLPGTGTHLTGHGTSGGVPSSDPRSGASMQGTSGATGTGGAGVVGSGTGSGSGGSGTGTGAGARAGISSGDTEVLPFKDGMTRPKLVSKVDPVYSREARDAEVQGLILTKCVITTEGELRRCRIVKGIPLMDQAVLAALSQWRYSPVLYQGKPATVEYLIPVRLVLP